MKKKICIDARMIESGGIGTYLKYLLSNIDENLFDINLLIDKKKIINNKKKQNLKFLKKFKVIEFDAPIYSIKEQFLFPLKIPKCDIFFSPHFNIPIFPIRAKKKVVTIHDMYHLAFFKSLNFLEKMYAKFVIKEALKKSHRVITVSNFSKSEILKYFKVKKDKISVVYNGIDLDYFKKSQDLAYIKKIKKIFYLPENYFLFVGNLKPHKNLKNIFLAFEKFLKKNINFSLVIVGRLKNLNNFFDIERFFNEKKALKKNVKILSNVKQELRIIYQLSKGVVYPSLYEGFGYPILEAWSVDAPVITSNIGSMKEIADNGAYLVNPKNINEISKAFEKIAFDKDLNNKLIKNGKNRLQLFTIDNFIKKHIEIFKKL